MHLVDLKVRDFLSEVDSSSPAPGGGSVSAFTSSLGVSLSRMVSHLTFNRKKFLSLEKEVRVEYEKNFKELNDVKDELLPLIDQDTEAFNKIMSAFKMPKETDEDKQKRKEAIQVATLEAIEVPYNIAKYSYKAFEIIKKMMQYGNMNAITDIGVGVLLLYAGLEGALLNVRINLGSLHDKEKALFYENEMKELLAQGKILRDEILNFVYEQL